MTNEEKARFAPLHSYFCDDVYVKNADEKGRGVFAFSDLPKDYSFECAPMIPFPKEECEWLDETKLTTYRYELAQCEEDGKPSICGLVGLGYSSLYNHSFEPNADYEIVELDNGDYAISLFSIKEIANDEEITINYNGEVDDQTALDTAYGVPGGITYVHYAGGGFHCDNFDEDNIVFVVDDITCELCKEAASLLAMGIPLERADQANVS